LGDSGETFFDKTLQEQVLAMGWSHACPVVNKVAAEYGPEWTLKRYAECNFVFGLVVEAAKDLNPRLYAQLIMPVARKYGEKPGEGRFDPDLVPNSFDAEMSPLTTPWGYAIPRVIIEEMGRGKGNLERTSARILKALHMIDDKVRSSKTPIELLVKLAESASKSYADPRAVLSHTLAQSVLDEEGCLSIFNKIKREIDVAAPTLKVTYDLMSPEERMKEGIITFKWR